MSQLNSPPKTEVVDAGSADQAEATGFWLLIGLLLVFLSGDFSLLGIEVRLVGLPVIATATFAWIIVRDPATIGVSLRTPLTALFLCASWLVATGEWAPRGSRVAGTRLDLLFLAASLMLTALVARRVPPRLYGRLWMFLLVISSAYWVLGFLSTPDGQGRWAVPGGGPNVFVRAMALGVVATLYWAHARGSVKPLLALIPFTFGALFSGSRGGVLSLVLVMAFALPPMARRWGRQRVMRTFALVIGMAGLTWSLTPADLRARFASRFVDTTFRARYTAGRSEAAETALELFDHEIWVGAGLDSVRSIAGLHAHNLVLSVMAEGGLIGLFLLGAVCTTFVRRIRKVHLTTEGFYFVVVAVLILSMSMFSGYYYDSRFVWFFLIIGCCASQGRRDQRAIVRSLTSQEPLMATRPK